MLNRTHRVGSFTLGISLVAIGIAYLMHLFFPSLSYLMIIQAWPIIFVLLGIEIILSNLKTNESTSFVYDKTAIFLTAMLILFSMGLGTLSMLFEKSTQVHLSL